MQDALQQIITLDWDTEDGKLKSKRNVFIQGDSKLGRQRACKDKKLSLEIVEPVKKPKARASLGTKKDSASARVVKQKVTKSVSRSTVDKVDNVYASKSDVDIEIGNSGYKTIDVRGDGDCFFAAAIASHPVLLEEYTTRRLRTHLCDYLEDNCDMVILDADGHGMTFEDLYLQQNDGYTSYLEWINAMRTPKTVYADVLVIYALANAFQVTVEILDMHLGTYATISPLSCADKEYMLLVRNSTVHRVPNEKKPGKWIHVTQPDEHYYGTANVRDVRRSARSISSNSDNARVTSIRGM